MEREANREPLTRVKCTTVYIGCSRSLVRHVVYGNLLFLAIE